MPIAPMMTWTQISRIAELSLTFSGGERRDVRWAEAEALGYARGRMDASEDHGTPWVGVDPIDFAQFHALHVAEHIDRYRNGQATSRRPIRDSWEAYLTA
jgi:hypothetical protein